MCRTLGSRLRHDLQARHRVRPLPVRGADAVGTGVAAADDDDVLALRRDLALHLLAQGNAVRRRKELHRLQHTVELAPGHRQVARHGRADRHDDRVEARAQVLARHVAPDVDPRAEPGALGLHLGDAPVDHRLLHLELGDAVAQQSARLVGTLVDRHRVSGAGQLLGRRQAGRPGAHDGHRLPGGDDAVVPGAIDDAHLDLLDRHGGLVDAQHAGGLARRRAEPAGELREVVRRVQPVDGLAPLALPREVVPLRNEVSEGTTAVAEGDTAIHTAAGLALQLGGGLLLVDLLPVLDADRHGATTGQLALPVLQEPLWVSHERPP